MKRAFSKSKDVLLLALSSLLFPSLCILSGILFKLTESALGEVTANL